ncbi:hypothetical protein [Streptomyces sporangiiformans]|uniref:hypothetical protein n=1 Tax=Streptomyces sporangiiformans TaxID=2315329 RepID=UPI000E5AE9A2|nr:hypothetical protein [Streptomyces sporangiiformans]
MPPVAGTPTPVAGTIARLPLDAYLPDAKQEAALGRARMRLANDCLRGFGLAATGEVPLSGFQQARWRRGQLLDERLAQKHGFHYTRYPQLPSSRTKTIAPPRSQPSSATVAVLTGRVASYRGKPVPAGGCRATADARLAAGITWPVGPKGQRLGDFGATNNFTLSLQYQAYERALRDDQVVQAARRWSACMKDRHHLAFDTPGQAATDRRWATKTVGTLERRVAVASVRCQLDVNYLGVQQAVQAAYEKEAIRAHMHPLQAIQKALHKGMANARAVLDSTSP